MLVFACLLAAATALPAHYDQRQDGEFNVRADVQNVVFLVAIPQTLPLPTGLFDGLLKSEDGADKPEAQQRSDQRVMEAFVEPNTPYHVEIGSDRSADGDGRAVEVVIAGRRRPVAEGQTELQAEPQEAESQPSGDEFKLLGATEQCGPERERDPVTLMCRARKVPLEADKPVENKEEVKPTPQVIST